MDAANIANMKAQIKRLGSAYDWTREFTTCEPEYYRWNQWFFLALRTRAGLPQDGRSTGARIATVLANEQVLDGRAGAARHLVERRNLEQWFFNITDYADDCCRSDKLDGWPEKVRTMQRNWIGRSEGASSISISTAVGPTRHHHRLHHPRRHDLRRDLHVQSRPSTPSWRDMAANNPELRAKVEAVNRRAAQNQRIRRHRRDRKTRRLHRPLRHQPLHRERVPIWVANYILIEYGTGAIMGVPRTTSATSNSPKKYELPIRVVILPVEWRLRRDGR